MSIRHFRPASAHGCQSQADSPAGSFVTGHVKIHQTLVESGIFFVNLRRRLNVIDNERKGISEGNL